MTDYDIIVVGAGPIGSTYAYKMAKKGYDVALFDMKNRIGQPLQCAGLVSTNICETKNLPKEYIDNKIRGANLYSPDNTQITVEKDKTVAYVLDRVMYDKHLFERAINQGVTPHLGERVMDADIENTTIKTQQRKYTSRLIAVSNGPTSQTSKKMNPHIKEEQFLGLQYTVKTENQDTDYVNLSIKQPLLPGFLWEIPTSPYTKRVGLFTDGSYNEAEQILKNKLKTTDEIIEKHNGMIPRFNPNKKITQNNTILLGDAAGQVKPTTGGGLISGFNCAEIATKNTNKMLEEENNKYLENYEKEYHKRYNSEFKAQQNVQNIIKEMTEDDFNYMFQQLKKHNVDQIISEHGDMDNQTPLLKELVKRGVIFKLVPKIGVRRLKNIWKSL
ncbi:NAD(P)/FAD-dependent oxidoreductase [Methanosphaera sp. ISO3-F5]|uniref:NAD(P)/FAD-dependent oxidoreductase n=1 Tax=Methanosphaera sp. ISO3-F5 TaxID=1452353 RepID=UPI002B25E081|nr:NAD(P)/FAD-dependent oxidoreductase [Methanosphaera sp. ISO3-F5]WQH64326.1 NAD(P)/FAD-dependent oxidoreductase [Methanosphaera sp. ISO3-F5]